MLAFAQSANSTATTDQFWQLGGGDLFSIFGFIIGVAALAVTMLIYYEIKKRERTHIVNALKITHITIANLRDHLRVFVTNSINRTGENNPDIVGLRRFMRDLHPIFSKDADRIERAIDPIRLYLPVELDTKLTSTIEYFRILANPAQNRPELDIPEAAQTWFARQREYVNELADLMSEIRRFAPEIPEIKIFT